MNSLTTPCSAASPKPQLILKFFQLLTENTAQMINGLVDHSVGTTALQNFLSSISHRSISHINKHRQGINSIYRRDAICDLEDKTFKAGSD